jgi:hypothetical protein
MLYMWVYMHSRFAENHLIRILKDGSLISEVVLSQGPHPESDLVTDLYYGSTPIANMDRSDCQISFSSLNKSVISLPAAIEHWALLYDPIQKVI